MYICLLYSTSVMNISLLDSIAFGVVGGGGGGGGCETLCWCAAVDEVLLLSFVDVFFNSSISAASTACN